jgi:hypothetical protein
VIWLAQAVGKPILKLTAEDYNEHGLQELIARGRPYDLNIEVFREPAADDHRVARAASRVARGSWWAGRGSRRTGRTRSPSV